MQRLIVDASKIDRRNNAGIDDAYVHTNDRKKLETGQSSVCMCVCVGVCVCPCLLYIKSPLYINSGSCDTSILLYTYLWREIYLFGTFSNNVQYPRNTRCDLFVFEVVGTVTKCVFYYTLKALNGSFEHSIQFKVYLL